MIKISNTNKSERITVYVSPNMKERINERAKACNMSVSDYMFACTVVTEINIIGDSDSFKKLVYEVNKIGANINQIRLLATLGKIDFVNFDECNETLNDIKKKIYSAIKKKSKWRFSSSSKEPTLKI